MIDKVIIICSFIFIIAITYMISDIYKTYYMYIARMKNEVNNHTYRLDDYHKYMKLNLEVIKIQQRQVESLKTEIKELKKKGKESC